MTNTEKNILSHISKILGEVDSYQIYKKISGALSVGQVESSVSTKVVEAYQEEFNVQYQKVKEAKNWIDTILSDHFYDSPINK